MTKFLGVGLSGLGLEFDGRKPRPLLADSLQPGLSHYRPLALALGVACVPGVRSALPSRLKASHVKAWAGASQRAEVQDANVTKFGRSEGPTRETFGILPSAFFRHSTLVIRI